MINNENNYLLLHFYNFENLIQLINILNIEIEIWDLRKCKVQQFI